MTDKPVILVCGLGRCGTSVTMQMLAAGGVDCAGAFPSFEVPDIFNRTVDAEWFAAQRGRAVKHIDPFRSSLPAGVDTVVIWLDRNVREQAKSAIKLGDLLNGFPHRPTRQRLRAMMAVLHRDRCRSLKIVRPALTLRFEQVLNHPLVAAARIRDVLSPWWPDLDVVVMGNAVVHRSPACAPGLDMETALIAAQRSAGA